MRPEKWMIKCPNGHTTILKWVTDEVWSIACDNIACSYCGIFLKRMHHVCHSKEDTEVISLVDFFMEKI